MAKFLFFGEKKEEKFLVLDIGTEAVKVLFLKKGGDDKITILGAATQYFEKYGIFNGRDFETEMIKKANLKAIEEVYKNFTLFSKEEKTKTLKQNWKKLPVLVSLPPNILKARIVWQSFRREKIKEKISKVEQELICQQVFEEAQKEISKKFAREFGILPGDIQWVSKKFLGIKIDGYSVSGLQGYEGKDLELKILTTFLPKYYLENIKRIFGDLQLKILKTVHIAENLSTAIRDKIKNGIFLDVGGEVTQIFFVKTDNLDQINEFETGGKMFSQKLSEVLGVEGESARNLKEQYANKLLSSGAVERVKEIFLPEKRIWYENLKLKIRETGRETLLPSVIFLFGGGSLLPEIQGALNENGIEVKFIYPEDLKDIEDSTKKFKNPQYIPSMLISHYGEKIF